MPVAVAYDVSGNVTEVIDGDTIVVENLGHIRLADVDSPEINRPGGPEAKDFAIEELLGCTVHLDVDDKTGIDNSGGDRLVCVVYLGDVNFNRLLADTHHACVQDYPSNEFDPGDWWDGYIPDTVCVEQPGGIASLNSTASQVLGIPVPEGKKYVGSRNSNKYHLPGCRWAKRINPENEVWFSNPEEAAAGGYVPCKSCLG